MNLFEKWVITTYIATGIIWVLAFMFAEDIKFGISKFSFVLAVLAIMSIFMSLIMSGVWVWL